MIPADKRTGGIGEYVVDGTMVHVYQPEDGILYCGFTDALVSLSFLEAANLCSQCPFFVGTAQGDGRECSWDTPVKDGREKIERALIGQNWTELSFVVPGKTLIHLLDLVGVEIGRVVDGKVNFYDKRMSKTARMLEDKIAGKGPDDVVDLLGKFALDYDYVVRHE